MTKYRIMLDLTDCAVYSRDCDAFEIEAGVLGYRDVDRALRPLSSDRQCSGERWIVTAWHDTAESARAEAAAELDRRIDAMRRLAERCLAGDATGGKA